MVVIDEATQATEPSTLIPLVGISTARMCCGMCGCKPVVGLQCSLS